MGSYFICSAYRASSSSFFFFFFFFSPFSPLDFFGFLGAGSCPSCTSSGSLSVTSSEECSLISSILLSMLRSCCCQPSSLSLMRPRSSSYILSLHRYVLSPPPPPAPRLPTPLTLNMLSFEVLNCSLSMLSTSSSRVMPSLVGAGL